MHQNKELIIQSLTQHLKDRRLPDLQPEATDFYVNLGCLVYGIDSSHSDDWSVVDSSAYISAIAFAK